MALATSSRRRLAWGGVVQRIGVGVLSGTLAGLVVGISARLAMRIVAVVIGLPPEFSPRGTLNIVQVGILIGVAPGVLHAVVRRWLPGPPILRGLTFGVLLFGAVGVYPLIVLSSVTEPDIHPLWLRWAVFGALSVVYGLALGATAEPVGRALPTPRRDPGQLVGHTLLALWGLAATAVFLAALASAELGLGPIH
jgi:hypothetical protein